MHTSVPTPAAQVIQSQWTDQQPITLAKRQTLTQYLGHVGKENGILNLILGDVNGQALAAWTRWEEVRASNGLNDAATLAAGSLASTLEMGKLLDYQATCNAIVQEHDDLVVLISRIGENLVLLVATMPDVPIGWSRLLSKRMTKHINHLITA